MTMEDEYEEEIAKDNDDVFESTKRKTALHPAAIVGMMMATSTPEWMRRPPKYYRHKPKVTPCARNLCTTPNTSGKDYCSAECCKLDKEEQKNKRSER